MNLVRSSTKLKIHWSLNCKKTIIIAFIGLLCFIQKVNCTLNSSEKEKVEINGHDITTDLLSYYSSPLSSHSNFYNLRSGELTQNYDFFEEVESVPENNSQIEQKEEIIDHPTPTPLKNQKSDSSIFSYLYLDSLTLKRMKLRIMTDDIHNHYLK